MGEIGDRMTVFEFGGLRDRQRDHIEAGFEVGAKPVGETVVEAVPIDDLEPRLTRSGYDVGSLAEQFDANPLKSAACYAVILTWQVHAN